MKEIKNIIINESETIINALKIINENSKGMVIVVDKEIKLIGTLTDGDIRRAIINGLSTNDSISGVCNKNCKYVYYPFNENEVKSIFIKDKIDIIPLVSEDKTLISFIEEDDIFDLDRDEYLENPVLIMAGGLGTRLKPLTDDVPKPMLKVGGKPILELIINQFRENGFRNILISVNYKSDIIKNYFRDGSDFGVNIKYIEEKNRMGTAGSIKLAKEYIDKVFIVINGDILTNINFKNMLNYHNSNDFSLTIGTRNYSMQVPYGVLEIENATVKALKEKPEVNYFISAGIYVLNNELVDLIPGNEYYDITQLIEKTIESKRVVGSFPISEYWMDIGQIKDYYKANEDAYKLL